MSVEFDHRAAGADPGSVHPSRRDAVGDWLDVFTRMLGLPKSEATAVRDELEDHLRSRVEDLLITGLSEPEAVRKAVAELGETAELAQRYHVARRSPRRRMAMHVALFTIAGTALLAASASLMQNHHVGSGLGGQAPGASVEVQPEEKFGESLHRYDVRELVRSDNALGNSSESRQLMETIVSLVHPDNWEQNGGEAGRISVVGNTLFIDAPDEMQEGVRWTLDGLRADAERIRMEADREADAQQKRLEASWKEGRAYREEAKKRAETDRAARLARLKARYEELCEQQMELSRQAWRLGAPPWGDSEKMDEAALQEHQEKLRDYYEAQMRHTEEAELNRMRRERVRALLVDLEFAGYEGLSPAPSAPGAATPAPLAPEPSGDTSPSGERQTPSE